jgi:hypothetical protein
MRSPKEEAWVGLDYRAGADGRLPWATGHYAKMGRDVVLKDHESGER